MKPSRHYTPALLVALLLAMAATSCNQARYLGVGENLLYDNVVSVEMADSSDVSSEVKDALKNTDRYILQRPNSRVFGIKKMRVGMWIYNLSSPRDSSFVGRYLRRVGQKPVVYDEQKARRSAAQLQMLLDSKGSFRSSVTMDTLRLHNRNISIGYHITATRRYIVDEVVYHSTQPAIRNLVDASLSDSPLQAGKPYDQEALATERERIATMLLDAGYFGASKERISFLVDTTYSPTNLSIDVYIDDADMRVFHINNIFVYPNTTTTLHRTTAIFDTLIYSSMQLNRPVDYIFVYDSPLSIKPQTICRSLVLSPGMTYRTRYLNATYNSLLNLRNFKYINVEFTPSPASTDSLPLLDAHVRLVNSGQQRISLSLELTNASPIGVKDSGNFMTNGNLGVQTSVEYRHRNLFHGAELLRMSGSLLLELPKLVFRGTESGFYDNFSAFEASLEASLDMPVLLVPAFLRSPYALLRSPHTLISLSGSYQYHYYFERILASTSFGYTWSSSQNHSHQILPLELTFVRMMSLDDDFAARLRRAGDLRLTYQYSSHFVMDARYDYTFSSQRPGQRQNFSYLHLTAETAGNILSLAGQLGAGDADSNGFGRLFGVPYAQYVRFGAEWSHYFYHGTASSFVVRALAGVGLPYGNSVAMPYEKSFFGGGPTTMRGWQLRRLGPGSYQGGDGMMERVGDIQLTLNLEERFPLFSIFEGAVFADLGNVWLYNSSSQYPGGEFTIGSFLPEVAVAVGLGLRLNVSVATIRLDFGIPIYDPGFATALRFRLPYWNFSQIVTNIGIGYPF